MPKTLGVRTQSKESIDLCYKMDIEAFNMMETNEISYANEKFIYECVYRNLLDELGYEKLKPEEKNRILNVVNEINTEEIIKEKLEAKIIAEIESRIDSGAYDDYINSEVERRMQTDEVKKIVQTQVEEQVKAKLAEEMAEQVLEDVDEILYTRENGETINERGIDIGLAQGREEGIEIGFKQGFEKGKQEGIEIGRESGYEKGLGEAGQVSYQKGLEVGRKQGLERVARTMYKDNYPLEEITKLTGLVLKRPTKK